MQFTRFLQPHFGSVASISGFNQVGILHHFSADEAARQVRVNGVRSVERSFAVAQGPGAHFVLSGGEEADVPERLVEQSRENVNRWLLYAEGRGDFSAFAGG